MAFWGIIYPMDNRKPPKVFLDPRCNVQSLGFLKGISSGDGTVNSWGENEVRVTGECQLEGQRKGDQKGEERGRNISEVKQPGHSDLPRWQLFQKETTKALIELASQVTILHCRNTVLLNWLIYNLMYLHTKKDLAKHDQTDQRSWPINTLCEEPNNCKGLLFLAFSISDIYESLQSPFPGTCFIVKWTILTFILPPRPQQKMTAHSSLWPQPAALFVPNLLYKYNDQLYF